MKTNLTTIVIILCLALTALAIIAILVMATTDEASANDATDISPSQASVRCGPGTQPGFYTVVRRGIEYRVAVCFSYRPRGVLP